MLPFVVCFLSALLKINNLIIYARLPNYVHTFANSYLFYFKFLDTLRPSVKLELGLLMLYRCATI